MQKKKLLQHQYLQKTKLIFHPLSYLPSIKKLKRQVHVLISLLIFRGNEDAELVSTSFSADSV